MPTVPDVSVLMVSYNTAKMTVDALRAVQVQTRVFDYEMIVVDNASIDGSADLVEQAIENAIIVREPQNLGFASANNKAARLARGRYVLLLNPDTLVLEGAIDKIVAFADAHPWFGIYGGATYFADGSLNPTAGWYRQSLWSLFCIAIGASALFPGNRYFDSESISHRGRRVPHVVDIVTGCFMLVERHFWDSLDGFDERFHMYGEDADLSLRAWQAGRACVLVPEAKLVHYGGASEPVRSAKMIRLFTAKRKLLEKHCLPLAVSAGRQMLRLWALNRALVFGFLSLFSNRFRDPSITWNDVLRNGAVWGYRS